MKIHNNNDLLILSIMLHLGVQNSGDFIKVNIFLMEFQTKILLISNQ